jgi:hypothetical protein
MLTVLFWNIQKKPLLHRVSRLATAHDVDVVLLTECAQPDVELLAALNGVEKGPYRCPVRRNDRFRVASKFPKSRFVEVFNDSSNRLSVLELRPLERPTLLLGVVHLPSPAEWGDRSDRFAFAQKIADGLRSVEESTGNARTILTGDFNLNPFDDVMVGVFGFHALMTRGLAMRRDQRVVKGYNGPAFFNPMWRFLTDRDALPAGTHYFADSKPVNHYWYTPDQVLVRPEVVDKLVDVQVLVTDGMDSLLDLRYGWPDCVKGSDHLPILFRVYL